MLIAKRVIDVDMARNKVKEKLADGAVIEATGAKLSRKKSTVVEGDGATQPDDANGSRAKTAKTINRNGIWKEKTSRHGECWRFFISWYDSQGQRCRRKGSGFRPKDEAQRAVDKIRADARSERLGLEIPKPAKPTIIGEAVDAYIESRQNKRAARRLSQNPHARTNYSPLNRLRDWEGFVGRNTLARTINEDSFLKWVAREKKRGLTLSSINRSITTIIACLHHARLNNEDMRGYVIPPRPIKKSAENKRTRILVEEEIVKISKALAAEVEYRDALDFFRIALGSAGRLDEVLGIRWSDIAGSAQRLFSSKTCKERWLDVPAVVAVLNKRREDGLGTATHAFACRDHWRRAVYKRVSEACGIPYGQRVEGAWTIHDLRHTALAHLLGNNVDLATVSKQWADHYSLAETTRYLHHTQRSKALATAASNTMVGLTSPPEQEPQPAG
jgi:integrase